MSTLRVRWQQRRWLTRAIHWWLAASSSLAAALFIAVTVFLLQPSPTAAAITMTVRAGAPPGVTEVPTNSGRLDLAGSDVICGAHRIEAVGDDNKYWDAEEAASYAAGVWQVIHDEVRNDANTLVQLRIVVTNTAGVQQRIIHDFGQVTITAGAADQTFTSPSKAQQDLTATERLAFFIIHDDADEPRMETGIGNTDATCDTRLVTPDLVVAGVRNRIMIISSIWPWAS